jgi:hypothetical protein
MKRLLCWLLGHRWGAWIQDGPKSQGFYRATCTRCDAKARGGLGLV